MKAYRKILRPELINYLNGLYEEKGSWWPTIVDDDQVFILVRDNHLRVLVYGGLLLMITIDSTGKIVCKTHEEYLNLRSEADPYVTISENHTAPPKRVEGLADFVQHYDKIKRRIKQFVDKERQRCHTISLNIKEIVEKEVGLVLEKSEAIAQNKAQFVDFQAVSDDGTMVFAEVKLFGNPEIRSLKPPVINQLRKYEGIIKSHEGLIIKAYAEQCETYWQLDGAFFKRKLPDPSNIHIFPTVRLIITDFDEGQLKYSLPKIRENIEAGMDWEQSTNNLIMIGKPGYVNVGHIFKGL
jgi:hypothetical protein